jgi:hypothetical protein
MGQQEVEAIARQRERERERESERERERARERERERERQADDGMGSMYACSLKEGRGPCMPPAASIYRTLDVPPLSRSRWTRVACVVVARRCS